MPRVFTIYCVTNKVNGKRYVGQTVGTVESRWQQHVSTSKQQNGCPLLGKAIRKYGRDAFTREIVETVSDQKSADESEKKWICQFQSLVPNGYNLDEGGDSGGARHESTKLLIGNAIRKYRREASPEKLAEHVKNTRWSSEHKIRMRELIRKGWVTRREKYGDQGHSKTADAYIEGQRKSWETRRARYGELGRATVAGKYGGPEHGRKTKEGLQRAKEARASRFVRINLLPREGAVS